MQFFGEVAEEHISQVQKAFGGKSGQRGEHRTMKGGEAGPLADGLVQQGDIGKADKDLGGGFDHPHVKTVDHAQRAEASSYGHQPFDLRICPHCIELGGTGEVVAGQIIPAAG